jgi:predicted nucleic acid-binding Zn ribbon protein
MTATATSSCRWREIDNHYPFSVGGHGLLAVASRIHHHPIPPIRLPQDFHTTTDFLARRERARARHYARRPKKIGDVLAQLITARGYGRIQADANFAAAWQAAVGPALAKYTHPGRLRRGVLEVIVANSMTVQELTFQKQEVLAKLQADLPDARIRDLRFRIGSI